VMRKESATAVTRSSTTPLVITGRKSKIALIKSGERVNLGIPNSPGRTTQTFALRAYKRPFLMVSAPSIVRSQAASSVLNTLTLRR
jgi:hypothetical protein